ncbi:MAG: alpha/beta fold hydrolase [Hyphomicrobiaceae bacterium]
MREIVFDGGQISYDVTEPPATAASPDVAIVFVHGIGADRTIWTDWRTALSPRMRTIVLDLPGHGRSFRPGAALDWDIVRLGNLVHAVAAHAGAHRVLLVGESIGGTICLAAAAGHAHVAGVVTCSTAHIGGSLAHVQGWRAMIDERGLSGWSQDMLEKRFFPGQATPTQTEWIDATQQASDPETILQLARILVGLDFTDRLNEIACPVLLIHPDSSPFIPLEIPVALKERLASAELMVIPRARHGIACSHAALCADAAIDFMDRHGLTD